MITTKTKKKPIRSSKPVMTAVVMAMGTFDDVPARVFTGPKANQEAIDWATRLSRSMDACDETIRTLCERMGWQREAVGVRKFRVVSMLNGIPYQIVQDIDVYRAVTCRKPVSDFIGADTEFVGHDDV